MHIVHDQGLFAYGCGVVPCGEGVRGAHDQVGEFHDAGAGIESEQDGGTVGKDSIQVEALLAVPVDAIQVE